MVTFPSWFRGAIVAEDGMPVIIVNSAIPLEIRRNALAHMLSHILMRLNDPHAIYPRDTQEPHREADVMAGQFVLPDGMVVEQARKWFNDYRYLARLFGVSESDMMEKMRDLGLIKSRGVVWDY
jgi:Zn-dependent peptidase ImmA (M78 family)